MAALISGREKVPAEYEHLSFILLSLKVYGGEGVFISSDRGCVCGGGGESEYNQGRGSPHFPPAYSFVNVLVLSAGAEFILSIIV